MDKESLRRKMQEITARDQSAQLRWKKRKSARFEQIANEPILPRLCNQLFCCAIISASAVTFYEVYKYFVFSGSSIGQTLVNLTISAFYAWLLFALPLIVGLLMQKKKGYDGEYYNKVCSSKRSKRGKTIRERCEHQLVVAAAITIILLLLYITIPKLINKM